MKKAEIRLLEGQGQKSPYFPQKSHIHGIMISMHSRHAEEASCRTSLSGIALNAPTRFFVGNKAGRVLSRPWQT